MEVPMNTPNATTSQNRQSTSVADLYRIWAGYAAGLMIFALTRNWIGFALWAVLVPVGKLIHVRYFPNFPRFLGYGPIADDVFPSTRYSQPTAAVVTYYSALACPFCSIVLARLEALQRKMSFTLNKVDVSLHPQLLASKKIKSVPVVGVGGNRLVGNVTSEQLASLIGFREPSLAASWAS
jgi:glutaredoxin